MSISHARPIAVRAAAAHLAQRWMEHRDALARTFLDCDDLSGWTLEAALLISPLPKGFHGDYPSFSLRESFDDVKAAALEIIKLKDGDRINTRNISWRILHGGSKSHAVQAFQWPFQSWTSLCGIGGNDGGENGAVKCKVCFRIMEGVK